MHFSLAAVYSIAVYFQVHVKFPHVSFVIWAL